MINTTKLPDTLSEVFTMTSLAQLKNKKGSIERQKYNNAKGNNEMDINISEQQRIRDARDIVLPLIKDSKIAEIKAALNPNQPIYILPVQQKENVGHNQIPRQFADILVNKLNGQLLDNIYRQQGSYNTDANTKTRLANAIKFIGKVPTDGQIIIIDDNYTSGNTIIALMQHIQDNGGKIILVSTLSASRYGKGLKATQDKIQQLINDVKLPIKEIERIMGHSLLDLTNAKINLIRLSTRQSGAAGLRRLCGSQILEEHKQKNRHYKEGRGTKTSQNLDTAQRLKSTTKITAKKRLQKHRARAAKSQGRSK